MKPALLCIDLQYLVAARGCGIFADVEACPLSADEQAYYFERLENQVLPNVQKLQSVFRDKGIEVIHLRVMSQTNDGRERTWSHKTLDVHCAPGSRESEFIESVAPRADELVVCKTAAGPFGNSNIEAVLRQLDIGQLYCCGVFSEVAVESTIRAAADFGYCPVLIEDATATGSAERQRESVARLSPRFCQMLDTHTLVEDLQQHLRSVAL